MTRSRRARGGSSSPSPEPPGRHLYLFNEESGRRSVAVVVHGTEGRASVDVVSVPAHGLAHVDLPDSDDALTVGCHTEDGRSGICTCESDDSGSIAVSLEAGTILLDLS